MLCLLSTMGEGSKQGQKVTYDRQWGISITLLPTLMQCAQSCQVHMRVEAMGSTSAFGY